MTAKGERNRGGSAETATLCKHPDRADRGDSRGPNGKADDAISGTDHGPGGLDAHLEIVALIGDTSNRVGFHRSLAAGLRMETAAGDSEKLGP